MQDALLPGEEDHLLCPMRGSSFLTRDKRGTELLMVAAIAYDSVMVYDPLCYMAAVSWLVALILKWDSGHHASAHL